jgi:hypothetical protein
MTAVCITGQYRSWDHIKDNILENIIKDDADVFYVCDRDLSIPNIDHEIMQGSQTFYDESTLQFFHSRKTPDSGVDKSVNMFYKIMKCNQLKLQHENKHNFKYDVVVRVRTDVPFREPIIFSEDADKIFVPGHLNHGGICDMFAYGSSHLMDNFCNVFPNIKQYIDEGCHFHPETILKYHCNKLSLNVVNQDIGILDIVRQ